MQGKNVFQSPDGLWLDMQVAAVVKLLYKWGYSYVENLTWVQMAPNNIILTAPATYAQRSHLTLFIFRKTGAHTFACLQMTDMPFGLLLSVSSSMVLSFTVLLRHKKSCAIILCLLLFGIARTFNIFTERLRGCFKSYHDNFLIHFHMLQERARTLSCGTREIPMCSLTACAKRKVSSASAYSCILQM